MGKQSFVCFLAGEQTVYYVENNRFTHINRFVFPAHGRQGKRRKALARSMAPKARAKENGPIPCRCGYLCVEKAAGFC